MTRAANLRGAWLLPLLTVAGTASAADTQWLPHVELSSIHSTNYLLATNPANKFSVTGANLDAGARFSNATPIARFDLDGGVTTTWLPGDSDFNTFGYYASTHSERRAQRSTWMLDAGYRRDAVVSADLGWTGDNGGGLGNPSTIDSGRISGKNYRNQFEVTPEVTFDLSQRLQLDLKLQHLGVDFSTLVAGDQVDFKRNLGQASLSFEMRPTIRLGVEVGAMSFSPDTGIEGSDTSSAALRLTRQFNEQSRFYLLAGTARTKPDNAARNTKSNFIGGVGSQHALRVSNVFVDLTRTVDGNSTGVLVVREALRFTLSRNTGPRSGLYLSLAGIHDRAAVDTPVSVYRPRKYAQGVVGVNWKASREMTVQVELVQAWQSFSGNSADANGTTGRVAVSWARLPRTAP